MLKTKNKGFAHFRGEGGGGQGAGGVCEVTTRKMQDFLHGSISERIFGYFLELTDNSTVSLKV